MDEEKARLCAKYEIGWWIAHGRRDYDGTRENMQNLYMLQYGMTSEQSRKAVELRIHAAEEHDVAEELERAGKLESAKIHWKKGEELLAKHFELL